MAGILDIIGGAGSAIGDAASGVGSAIGDAGSALQNMAGSAVKAAQPAISGAGNWLMGSGEYTDPEAAMRRQAQLNMLMKLGGTLMAAGAYQSPESRAKQLARLGDVGTSYTSDLFKQQQARLMAAQLKQQMSVMSGLDRIARLQKTPEGVKQIMRQTGIDSAELAASTPPSVVQDMMLKRATMDPRKRLEMEFARKMLAGGAPTATQPSGAPQPTETQPAGAPQPTAGGIRDTPYFKYLQIVDPVKAKAMLDLRTASEKAAEKKASEVVTDYSSEGSKIMNTISAQDNINTAINKAKDIIKNQSFLLPQTGVLGTVLSVIPAYRRDLETYLDTVKSNLGFGELKQMKDESKNGGALGQVSDTENRLLASTIAGLDAGMSASALQEALTKISAHLERGRRRSILQFEKKFGRKFNPEDFGGNLPTGASASATSSSTPGYKVINVR